MFNNAMLENNSIIQISRVGKDDESITCNTEKESCCKDSRSGEWYYPNKTIVPNMGFRYIFYRDRDNEGNIKLHRAHKSSITGKYCCQVPDKNCDGLNHTLCVELGMLNFVTTSIDCPSFNLLCSFIRLSHCFW